RLCPCGRAPFISVSAFLILVCSVRLFGAPLFFLTHTPPTETSTLSLHDALPIWVHPFPSRTRKLSSSAPTILWGQPHGKIGSRRDRKSTRLNSSHGSISYAVFCLKKKRRSRLPL